jgi:hypothetical protein
MSAGALIFLLRLSGVIAAPLLFLNTLRGIMNREGQYDADSRKYMFWSNTVGLLLAIAWFIWSLKTWLSFILPFTK